MSKTTRATQTLDKLGVKFTLHTYDYDPDAESIWLQAAESLGVGIVIVSVQGEFHAKLVQRLGCTGGFGHCRSVVAEC